jgi:hypothetical protein
LANPSGIQAPVVAISRASSSARCGCSQQLGFERIHLGLRLRIAVLRETPDVDNINSVRTATVVRIVFLITRRKGLPRPRT